MATTGEDFCLVTVKGKTLIELISVHFGTSLEETIIWPLCSLICHVMYLFIPLLKMWKMADFSIYRGNPVILTAYGEKCLVPYLQLVVLLAFYQPLLLLSCVTCSESICVTIYHQHMNGTRQVCKNIMYFVIQVNYPLEDDCLVGLAY